MQRGRARHTVHCGRWESLHPGRRSGRGPGRRLQWTGRALCIACRLYRDVPRLAYGGNAAVSRSAAEALTGRTGRDASGPGILALHGHRQSAHQVCLDGDAHQVPTLVDDGKLVVPALRKQGHRSMACWPTRATWTGCDMISTTLAGWPLRPLTRARRRWPRPSCRSRLARRMRSATVTMPRTNPLLPGWAKVWTMLETTYRPPSNRCTRPGKHALYCM